MNIIEFRDRTIAMLMQNVDMARAGIPKTEWLVPMGISAPGLGKTTILKQIETALGNYGADLFSPKDPTRKWKIRKFDLRTEDPIDFAGAVKIGAEKSGRLMPEWFPTEPMTILVFEEIHQARREILNIAATLLNEGTLRDHETPYGTQMIANGNPPGTVAGTQRLPGHTVNRVQTMSIEADYNVWKSWAIINGVDPMVAAFLSRNPQFLSKPTIDGNPFPSPRSWMSGSYSAKIDYSRFESMKGKDKANLRFEAFRSAVGEEASEELKAFEEMVSDLPSIEKILSDPHNAEVPTTLEKIAHTTTVLSRTASKNAAHFDPILTYMDRIGLPEWTQTVIETACRANPGLQTHKRYIDNKLELSNIEAKSLSRVA